MSVQAPEKCPVCAGSLSRLCRLSADRSIYACDRCGLRRLLPLPSAEELRAYYGRPEYLKADLAELHDQLTAGYDREAPIIRLYRRHLDAIAAQVRPPAKLLEVGCARGVLLDLARQAGYEVAGVEVNGYAADYARENFGLNVLTGDLSEVDPGEQYDIVVALDVIEHLPDPASALARLASFLRPGGLAVIGTPDRRSFLYRLAEALARWTGGRWTYPARRFYGRGWEHLTVFSRQDLSDLAANVGLSPLDGYGYSIPLGNITGLGPVRRLVLAPLLRRPYEFVLLARKK